MIPKLQIGDLLGGAHCRDGHPRRCDRRLRDRVGLYLDVLMTDAVFVHAFSPFLSVLARGEDGVRIRHEPEALFASQPLAHWAVLGEHVDCGVTQAGPRGNDGAFAIQDTWHAA